MKIIYVSLTRDYTYRNSVNNVCFTTWAMTTNEMKELSKENRLDENVIYSIMTEIKANQKEKISFKMEDIDEYFPKDYTPRQKSEVILKLLKSFYLARRAVDI